MSDPLSIPRRPGASSTRRQSVILGLCLAAVGGCTSTPVESNLPDDEAIRRCTRAADELGMAGASVPGWAYPTSSPDGEMRVGLTCFLAYQSQNTLLPNAPVFVDDDTRVAERLPPD